ncbi:GGDEF domain-containing protein [Candidatus Omnitrophota bacterium]
MLKKVLFLAVLLGCVMLLYFSLSPTFCTAHYIVMGAFLVFIIGVLSRKQLIYMTGLCTLLVSLTLFINSILQQGAICLLCLVPFFISLALLMVLQLLWKNEITTHSAGKEKIDEEVNALEERLDNKQTTLLNLEQQVTDIIDLFEVAKDFNQCLTIDAVVSILKNRVSHYLHCEHATLVMLHDAVDPRFNYKAYIFSSNHDSIVESIASEDIDESSELDMYIQACIDHKDIIRIDYPIQYEDYFEGEKRDVNYPLWLFPLIVENKLIAAYIINGAQVNDFPKFSIIAAQLALQIKKIKLYEDVRELSITDGLTKFFLRRHFNERFEEELKRSIKYGHSLSVLMIDVDHFKEYNDNYGHLVGDATLREVSNIIRDNIRKVDLTGRYGGEEFILVLPETNKEGGIDAAERIRSAVARKSMKVYDEETKITISVGVSSFPDVIGKKCEEFSQDIIDLLVKKADDNLYKAKQDGRNRVICE